jgi:hypothetical protein
MLHEACQPNWYCELCFTYDQLVEHLRKTEEYTDKKSTWVFRGQPADRELQTTLERECEKSGIRLTKADHIEEMTIREFRRVYGGEDRLDVLNDTLYCLSLLRHHGAPTRLLDFTYSQYVALYFGLKDAYDSSKTKTETVSFALWCIDAKDMNSQAERCHANDPSFISVFKARAHISKRNDKSFRNLYMLNKYDLVTSENPARLHKRLHLQQGVQLCPGKVTKPFMENLHYLYDSGNTTRVRKLVCMLKTSDLEKAFANTRRMNITEESLFPGLDGQARSMKYQMWFLNRLYGQIHKAGGS